MRAPTRPSGRCRTLLLEVSRYLDGELTPARRRAVEQHIGTCACCRTLSAQLQSTLAACRAEGQAKAPLAVMSRAAARIRTLVAREGRRSRR